MLFELQVRKLEFLLEDALQLGCRHVITCGGVQSNHCRAVAVACAQLGLKAHLLLRTDDQVLAYLFNQDQHSVNSPLLTHSHTKILS